MVNLLGELNYEHYGEVYQTVDMRAEVGLLTRYLTHVFIRNNYNWVFVI